jgi:hypothetical protein
MKTFNEDDGLTSGIGESSNIAGLGIGGRASRNGSRPASSMSMYSDIASVSAMSDETNMNVSPLLTHTNNNPGGVTNFTSPSQRPKLSRVDTWNLINDVKKLKSKGFAKDKMKVRNLDQGKKDISKSTGGGAGLAAVAASGFKKPRLTKVSTIEDLLGKKDFQFDQLVSQSNANANPKPSHTQGVSQPPSRSPSPALALRLLANNGSAAHDTHLHTSPEQKLKALLDKQRALVNGATSVMGTSSDSYKPPSSTSNLNKSSNVTNSDNFEFHEIYDSNNSANARDHGDAEIVNMEMFNLTPEGTADSQTNNNRNNNNTTTTTTTTTTTDANTNRSKNNKRQGQNGHEVMDITLDDYFRENEW